jgi:hypothetical protein
MRLAPAVWRQLLLGLQIVVGVDVQIRLQRIRRMMFTR